MPSKKQVIIGGTVVGGLLVAAIAFMSGDAKADGPSDDTDTGNNDLPAPPEEEEPAPAPDPGAPPDTGDVDVSDAAWGVVPQEWRNRYAAAANALGIQGAAQAMAVIAWRAWRAGKDPVSLAEAAQLAKDPNWCRLCHNTTTSERNASRDALVRVTTPKSEGGAYSPPWPKPNDFVGWGGGVAGDPSKGGGSVGLFDILLGAHCHDGIHNGYTPLVNQPWTVMFEWRPQFYCAGWIIYRCIHRQDLPVLAPTALETWSNIGACWATPEGFKQWKAGQATASANKAAKAAENFKIRAAELGIDFSKVENPDPKTWSWPGPKQYWLALGAAGLGGGNQPGGQQPGNQLPAGLTAAEKAMVELVAAERPTSTDLAPAPYDKQRKDGTQTEAQWLTNVALYRLYVPEGLVPGPLSPNSPYAPPWKRMHEYMQTRTFGQALPGGDEQPAPDQQQSQGADEKYGEYTVRRIKIGTPGAGSVVWLLHGLGGGLDQLQGLVSRLPDGEYVLLTRGSSWIASPNGEPNTIAGQLADRGFKLLQLRAQVHGNDARPWVVVGYSQGGSVAYNMLGASAVSGLRMPDALAIASARLPGAPIFGQQRSTVIRAVSGTADNTVPTAEAQAAAEILANAGFSVDFKTIPGVGHSLVGIGNPLRQALLAELPQSKNA